MQMHRFAHLHAHGERGVHAAHGFLENHGDAVAPHGPDLFIAHLQEVLPIEEDFAALDVTRWIWNQAQDGQGCHAFA